MVVGPHLRWEGVRGVDVINLIHLPERETPYPSILVLKTLPKAHLSFRPSKYFPDQDGELVYRIGMRVNSSEVTTTYGKTVVAVEVFFPAIVPPDEVKFPVGITVIRGSVVGGIAVEILVPTIIDQIDGVVILPGMVVFIRGSSIRGSVVGGSVVRGGSGAASNDCIDSAISPIVSNFSIVVGFSMVRLRVGLGINVPIVGRVVELEIGLTVIKKDGD